ncbi:hypothetical protein CW304_11730 [Bacillus sp. UFRGS-B20]|nr:hypothetical protein CW304_11730 [Bacillus sp. UFRGS-B20]
MLKKCMGTLYLSKIMAYFDSSILGKMFAISSYPAFFIHALDQLNLPFFEYYFFSFFHTPL